MDDNAFEQYAIQVNHLLRADNEPPLDNAEVLIVYENGFSVEGAAGLIVTTRREFAL